MWIVHLAAYSLFKQSLKDFFLFELVQHRLSKLSLEVAVCAICVDYHLGLFKSPKLGINLLDQVFWFIREHFSENIFQTNFVVVHDFERV